MIHIEDIHSLSEFQRNAKKHIDYVNKTGRVEVITINGEPGAVLMGKDEYSNHLKRIEELKTLAAIDRGLEDFENGDFYTHDEVMRWLKK